MAKKIIYFNNSSLRELACSRRYYYRVVKGAKVQQNQYMKAGILFHEYAERMTSDDNIFTLTTPSPERPKLFDDLAPLTAQQVATLAQHAYLNGHIVENPKHRELNIDLDVTDYVIGQFNIEGISVSLDFEIHMTATIDQFRYHKLTDTVIIEDHKTTASEIDGEKIRNYRLTSQLPFYHVTFQALARRMLGVEDVSTRRAFQDKHDITDEMLNAAAAGRISTRYRLYSYTKQSIVVDDVRTYHEAELTAFKKMIDEKLVLAAALHLDQSLHIKEGITFGHCTQCPFKSICAIGDPDKEAETFSRWPLGFEDYKPAHLKGEEI